MTSQFLSFAQTFVWFAWEGSKQFSGEATPGVTQPGSIGLMVPCPDLMLPCSNVAVLQGPVGSEPELRASPIQGKLSRSLSSLTGLVSGFLKVAPTLLSAEIGHILGKK